MEKGRNVGVKIGEEYLKTGSGEGENTDGKMVRKPMAQWLLGEKQLMMEGTYPHRVVGWTASKPSFLLKVPLPP